MPDDWSSLGRLVGGVILAASAVAACGVLARAIRTILRLLREIDRRIEKLARLTDPNGDQPDDGTS